MVNNVAIKTLKILYPQLIDIDCFSHTIDHVDFIIPTFIRFYDWMDSSFFL